MINFILFDDQSRISLRPLTFFRPVSAIRTGILTVSEKWEKHLNYPVSHLTEQYLQEKFPLKVGTDNFLINGSILPNQELIAEILSLDEYINAVRLAVFCVVEVSNIRPFLRVP